MIEFYTTLLQHLPTFVMLAVGVSLGFYLLMQRHIFSVFDPLFFLLIVNEALCATDVIFMYQYGMIETRFFLNYLLTEGALLVGILQFKPVRPKGESGPPSPPNPALITLYRLSLPLFIGLNLLVYALRGIPLFLESRTGVFAAGGGFGLVRRLSDVLLIVVMYALLAKLRYRKWSISEWFAIFTVVLIQVLSGAKSAVLNLVFIAALCGYYTGTLQTRAGRRMGRMMKRLAIASVAALLIVAQVQSGDGDFAGRKANLLGQVASRLVNSGDALIYTYPDQAIEQLPNSNPLGAMFREYLTFFRLATPEQLPRHLGAQITTQFLNPNSPYQTNEKHNIVGYIYFGFWGSILFSYLVGTSVGFLRFAILHKFPRSWIIGIPFVILNLNVASIANELDGFHQSIIGVAFFFFPIALSVSYFIRNRQLKIEPITPK